jgi:hypothetical protein
MSGQGAAGAGTGADWTNAYTTLAAALTAKAAGDDFWVSEDHAETQASAMTLTSPGTVGTPCRILCVNHSGTVPPVSADLRATATVTTTGNSAITVNGSFYCYGIIFSCGNGANSPQLSLGANASAQVYEACAIRSGATSNPFMNVTGASVNNQVTFINTTVQFAAAAAFLSCGQGFFTWKNTASAITGATLPTTLFKVNVNRSCIALIEGVDLSALGSGKTLVSGEATPQQFVFKDCRLGASVTVSGTPTAPSSMRTDLIRGDSSGTNYRTERYRYEGTQTAETPSSALAAHRMERQASRGI